MWSIWAVPHCISTWKVNSYTLETLTGVPLNGVYHVWRLHAFHPQEGTKLALSEATCCNAANTEDKSEEEGLTPQDTDVGEVEDQPGIEEQVYRT